MLFLGLKIRVPFFFFCTLQKNLKTFKKPLQPKYFLSLPKNLRFFLAVLQSKVGRGARW